MKKLIIVIAAVLIFFSATAFILIPKQLVISEVTLIKANESAVFRQLSDQTKWLKWWPTGGEKGRNVKKGFSYNGINYHLATILYHAIDINIINKNNELKGKISIIPLAEDSIAVQWETVLITSNNPVTKFLRYQTAKKIKNNMTVILSNLKSFSEDKDNIYAFNIRRTTLKDTFLVAVKTVTPNYPSTDNIYDLIKVLRTYISSQQAKEVDFPILNITKKDSLHYDLMVAIPTDKRLNGKGNITFKRMVAYKDKTLTAEVKGGRETIKKAYDELHLYMNDYYLVSPVIPWESLITDRSKETDSTKWITKIFIPIV